MVAISGNSEIISPGVIRSEVGHPGGLRLTPGRPTSERITPGEILSELPEIATPVRFWPKFLENHTAVNLQKISRGLLDNEHACFSRNNLSQFVKNEFLAFDDH